MGKKGKAKNTVNKAKHSKLLNRKISKLKQKKLDHKSRLKELNRKMNKQKNNDA